MKTIKKAQLSPEGLFVDGNLIAEGTLNEIYKAICGDYPKFHKMDGLCKTGFLGAEAMLKDERADNAAVIEDSAVVLFNRSGSLVNDRNYEKTIRDPENYFPSPAIFVYTLANIVTGEIAIRNKMMGESSFYIMEDCDWKEIDRIAEEIYTTSNPPMILTGWVEYETENNYRTELRLVTKE